ncbi:aldo/keto reductase [Natronomonas sp. EA1]|uniref:aldo/keto reductase n=1 Tax=Natronomonas sp. EA1 TaxID=3421655 RepID=UPI003EBB5A53
MLEHVPLGNTGTSVTNLSFGTWRFGRENDDGEIEVGKERAHELLDAYAEAGGNFIDTADMYGDGLSEQWIGDWLATRDREEFVVASKIYWPTREGPNGQGLGRKHLEHSIDAMLDRLGTDYIDLLYIHRWDDATPAEEFMRTLNRFVTEGKVHYLGTSTFEPNAWKVAKANELAERKGYEPFTVAQPRYSLVTREVEYDYVEACEHYDIGICPWSPLGGGFLTGKYGRDQIPEGSRAAENETFAERYLSEENFDALDVVRAVAEEVGATPAQVSLAWLMHHEQVTAPIVGARTVEQLEENLAAAEVDLTEEQFERLSEAKDAPSLV